MMAHLPATLQEILIRAGLNPAQATHLASLLTDPTRWATLATQTSTDAALSDLSLTSTTDPTTHTPILTIQATNQPAIQLRSEPTGTITISGGQIDGPVTGVNLGNIVAIYPPSPAPTPPPAFQVPYPPSVLFVGREQELERVAALLDEDVTIAVVPAIAGTRGIGKTMLAAEFAHRYHDRFPGGVFWLTMEDSAGVATQVAACAGPGGLHLPGYAAWSFEQQIAAVKNAWNQPDRRLVIFDNLEDPALLTWRPSGGGSRVLITTRRATWTVHSGVRAAPLDTLPRPESLRLLLTPRYGAHFPDDPAADAICEALGDLPLAIALAGTYLEQFPSVTFTDYQRQITTTLIADESLNTVLEEGLPTRHAPSIIATFAASYERLQTDDPIDTLARSLFHRAAQCAPVPIPRDLLVRMVTEVDQDPNLTRQIDAALRRLLAVGLLDELENKQLRLHRLLAAFARSVTADPDDDRRVVVEALSNILLDINEAGYPQVGLPYLEHARHVVGLNC